MTYVHGSEMVIIAPCKDTSANFDNACTPHEAKSISDWKFWSSRVTRFFQDSCLRLSHNKLLPPVAVWMVAALRAQQPE